MEKNSFYKFTHTHLLKSDDQLKQKSDKKKEEAITEFILKKNHVPKKRVMSS